MFAYLYIIIIIHHNVYRCTTKLSKNNNLESNKKVFTIYIPEIRCYKIYIIFIYQLKYLSFFYF